MSLFGDVRDWWNGGNAVHQTGFAQAPTGPGVQAFTTIDLHDGIVADFLRGGSSNAAGAVVNSRTAIRNAAVYRSVTLIANVMATLPLQLWRREKDGERVKAREHPLYDVLFLKPNGWQSAFNFRRLMQHWALTEGNAYAVVVRRGDRVVGLNPVSPLRVTPKQRDDWSVYYEVRGKSGGIKVFDPGDIFHLMGPSSDGVRGLALTDFAADVLGLSIKAQEAAARVFKNGVMAGGALSTDGKLTPEMVAQLRDDMEARHTGAENAHRWFVLEGGLKATTFAPTAKDSQNVETRQHQIEEVARIFGVPRPFLMVDDTSWGSGIEQLGIYFVQYGLAPWFKAWEESISLTLLSDADRRAGLYPKFNERALLRGSMKDQAEYLSKLASGAGGSKPIMEVNEAREVIDLRAHDDGFGLGNGLLAATGDAK